MERTIEVTGLRKRFGQATALDGMTFTVEPGQVTGFVGPNGAGKSTTMRVILGLDAADAGTATIGGRPNLRLRRPLRHIGALLDAGALQPSRSARNHLLWLAHSQGLSARPRVDSDADRAERRQEAQGRRLLPRHAPAPRHRRRAARRPTRLDDGRAVQRHGPRGHRLDARLPARPGPRGPRRPRSSHLISELPDTADHLVVVGRGKVIADRPVADLIAAASGDRVGLRTLALTGAITVLANAGAEVAATAPDVLTVTGLSAQRVVAVLTASQSRSAR